MACLATLALVCKGFAVMTDLEREQAIESYRLKLVESRDPLTKRIAALRMKELIAERSPQRIEEMERERGLRVS